MKTWKAAALGFPVILAFVLSILGASYLITAVAGLPPSVGHPVVAEIVGGGIVVVGLGFAGWAVRQRGFAAMIASTYLTLAKAFGRIPVSEMAGRTEPLVVGGPQKYTRNPLYLGVIVMVLGWAVMTGTTYLFVSAVVFYLWFGMVLIPFEERELKSLFGQQWVKYSAETPMLIPFAKRPKREAPAP